MKISTRFVLYECECYCVFLPVESIRFKPTMFELNIITLSTSFETPYFNPREMNNDIIGVNPLSVRDQLSANVARAFITALKHSRGAFLSKRK